MPTNSTNRAGSRRRARRPQNRRRLTVPDFAHSFTSSAVMRNPLRTKKTLTEMKPPVAQPNPLWLAMIPMIEKALTPSRADT